MSNDRFWQNKLLALLHDPPDKAYNYGPVHEQRAGQYASLFGLSPEMYGAYKSSDWSAAAADRFILPSGQALHKGLGGGVAFIHPLSGKTVFLKEDYPKEAVAHDIISQVCPRFSDGQLSADERFFLAWRLWMEQASRSDKLGADKLPYLPADTRNPDGTIWHHNAVTSAIESTRDASGVLRPAFLLFQLGPIQEFIAQARSTRDLWSGSYLLSWLMAHAMQSIALKYGPDCIIFPSLRGQPLFDWLNKDILQKARFDDSCSYWDMIYEKNKRAFEEQVLTPNLPNCFLAVVPDSCDPEKEAAEALCAEWKQIAIASNNWLLEHGCAIPKPARFEEQVKCTWNITWQLWPWQPTKQALDLFKTVPVGKENALHIAHEIADKIPGEHKDKRCYRDGDLNIGWAWNAHYQLCRHRLDARRQTREFDAWQGADNVLKDVYSGKEETVIDEKWLEGARANSELGYLFRSKRKEVLGAVNLIKRVWHKAYLEKEEVELKRVRKNFDSISAVAAAPWCNRVLVKLSTNDDVWQSFVGFQSEIKNARCLLDFQLPDDSKETSWLKKVDAGVFHQSFWDDLEKDNPGNEIIEDARKALKALLDKAASGKPAKYYAVLALDGDKIGKWLSGENTPSVEKVITSSAADYFRENVKHPEVNTWLKAPRPVSPAYHLQFSEALSNFGLFCACRIVEHHHGQLIYAGGDDVLAMLPAEEAVACAEGLRMAFRGDEKLSERYPYMFCKTEPGFVRLKDGDWNSGTRMPAEPSWPLLVPGETATASVGIAIGHINEPLQDMVEAAQKSEKRAKREYDRDSLAVTIFKRSGEQIKWGTKFTSAPFDLLAFLNRGDTYKPPIDDPKRAMPISGKFPYRICELLRVYGENASFAGDRADTLHDIAEKEIDWAVNQLKAGHEEHSKIFLELQALIHDWLDCAHNQEISLADFYNLFAVEAFIARQGE